MDKIGRMSEFGTDSDKMGAPKSNPLSLLVCAGKEIPLPLRVNPSKLTLVTTLYLLHNCISLHPSLCAECVSFFFASKRFQIGPKASTEVVFNIEFLFLFFWFQFFYHSQGSLFVGGGHWYTSWLQLKNIVKEQQHGRVAYASVVLLKDPSLNLGVVIN